MMKVKHKLQIYGKCPVDGANDNYTLVVKTRKILKVEDILAAVSGLKWPLFQEEVTQILADELGCNVRTVGYHSGIKTTCEV